MTSTPSSPRARWYRAFPLIITLVVAAFAAQPDSLKRTFDLPADSAEKSIRRFSEQSGLEVFYPSSVAKGVRTHAVKGEFTAREALDAMVAGTGLVIVRDERTGAFSVKRDVSPNVERAALTNRDRPASESVASTAGAANGRRGEVGSATEDGETIQLSPFEVSGSGDRGYYGANTMSGTRLNSKIEDLAASITVITKEQMQDFAMLDVNDIFNYEVSTEGTGNYTDFTINSSNDQPADNVQLDPQNANRVRGVGAVNKTVGNFEVSGRTPIDPVDIDAVEISRGPNSSIFGIGNPAGSVNAVPASANLSRNTSQLTARVDSFDGYRTSVDLNRVLKPGRLAVRGSAVYQHDGFDLKPSGTDSRRFNGMVKFKPFKATELSASYSLYNIHGNRPNATTPRDAITRWKEAGAPTWDPITSTAKINGQVAGTFLTSTPFYFNTNNLNYAQAYIDQGGLSYLGTGRTTSATTPATQNQTIRLMNAQADPSGILLAQPLLGNNPTTADRSIYDWTRVNLASSNRIEDKSETTSLLLSHIFIDNAQQTLAVQVGWFREQTERFTRNMVGGSSGATIANVLQIDVNERLLDGRPNPYFLRPFFGAVIPETLLQPQDRDTYRAQVAYKIDFTGRRSWLRWLGAHQLSGYGEYKEIQSRTRKFRDVITSNHSWLGPNELRGPSVAVGTLASAVSVDQLYHRYYMGDAQGYNVDYGPSAFAHGNYALNWGNGVTGAFVNEPVTVGSAPTDQVGGIYSNRSILKTKGLTLQNRFLRDRIITTFGLRRDQRYTRNGGPIAFLDGMNLDYDTFNTWAPGDWALGQGNTTTAGVVARPLRWLSVHLNRSNSFQPAALAYSLHRELLPDPTGNGEDYGVALNLFAGKLIVRVNRYETNLKNARSGASANIAQRMFRLDFPVSGAAYVLQRLATTWVTTLAEQAGETLTTAEINQRTADYMKLPVKFIESTERASATDDLTSRGTEIEVNYNPTNYWTMKANVAESEAINSAMAQEVTDWIAERTPVWESIIDPLLGRPWFTERYNNSSSARDNLQTGVIAPLKVEKALEGKSRPQIRKYRANFSTNFRLSGITGHPVLKRFNLGGALRWEDKGAIGYWGVETLPALIETLDATRPIYDKSHLYADAFVAYRTRLFSEKVTATFQLNVRNLNEDGRLQPIAADPDGTVTAYRIVSPRQFILSATFSL